MKMSEKTIIRTIFVLILVALGIFSIKILYMDHHMVLGLELLALFIMYMITESFYHDEFAQENAYHAQMSLEKKVEKPVIIYKFKQGDVVKVKSENFNMTVSSVRYVANELQPSYSCIWFDQQNNYKQHWFFESSLKSVD
jgi:uncharacterized protein YodC (DUF2158 family)